MTDQLEYYQHLIHHAIDAIVLAQMVVSAEESDIAMLGVELPIKASWVGKEYIPGGEGCYRRTLAFIPDVPVADVVEYLRNPNANEEIAQRSLITYGTELLRDVIVDADHNPIYTTIALDPETQHDLAVVVRWEDLIYLDDDDIDDVTATD